MSFIDDIEKPKITRNRSGLALRVWSEQDDNIILALWPTTSASEIAIRLGDNCTKNAVVGRAHRIGASKKGTPIKPLNDEEKEKAFSFYNKGISKRQIGMIMGRSESCIRDLVDAKPRKAKLVEHAEFSERPVHPQFEPEAVVRTARKPTFVAPVVLPVSALVPESDDEGCQFIFNDSSPYHFCGAARRWRRDYRGQILRTSWCAEHYDIVYRTVSR